MRTLYIDCSMGAAGDMLTAALSDLLPDKEAFFRELKEALPENVTVSAEKTVKLGVTGCSVRVLVDGCEEDSLDDHDHEHHHHHDHHHHDHELDHHHHDHDHEHHHHHASLSDIEAIIAGMPLPGGVKSKAVSVYRMIAEAESEVHGREVGEVHFHEVGALDAVADVCAVCLLMEKLAPERVVVSPVHVGSGHVRCAHGILPVPAPATAILLKGVPTYGGEIEAELCTPTGAALLRAFADSFGPQPVMSVERIGMGMGKKDLPRLNCVRALIGESAGSRESVYELVCSMDDITGEALAFASEELLSAGALDVYTLPIYMKKGRPAYELCCICREEDRESLAALIFRHTTTLGIRERKCGRYTLRRREVRASTQYGEIGVKISEGYGTVRRKAEYEDAAGAARKCGTKLSETVSEAEKQSENL